MSRVQLGLLVFGVSVAALGLEMAYALRNAAAFQDDFVYLALARHLDTPWVLLTEDSVGSYFFRPVVMLVWWVSDAAFAGSIALHASLGIGVHLATGLLLYTLLGRHEISWGVAAFMAVAFIAHPAASATAAWLSARFDLFAAAFGLAGLIAVDRYMQRTSPAAFLAAVLLMLASILSKETGFAATALGILALGWAERPRHAATSAARFALAGAFVVTIVAALAMRTAVLRPVPEVAGLWKILLGLLTSGTWKWLLSLPSFVVVPEGRIVSVVLLVVTLIALVLAAMAPNARTALLSPRLLRLTMSGVLLMGLTAAAQSPTTANVPLHPFSLDSFQTAAVPSARFYYLPLLGLAFIAAALGDAIVKGGARGVTLALGVLAAVSVVGMAATGRSILRQWSAFTLDRSEVHARPAVEAVTALRGLPPGCKVYLLDSPPDAGLLRDMIDTGVKKSLPRGHPALSCFIQAEHAPWYHLLDGRGLPVGAERPFEIIEAAGRPYPPLPVGNLIYYYVRIVPGEAIAADARATFMSYRAGRYVDVTPEVRSGAIKPRFFDRRAGAQ